MCVRDERVCECWQQRGYLGCCWLIGFHRQLMLQCVTSISALAPCPLTADHARVPLEAMIGPLPLCSVVVLVPVGAGPVRLSAVGVSAGVRT